MIWYFELNLFPEVQLVFSMYISNRLIVFSKKSIVETSIFRETVLLMQDWDMILLLMAPCHSVQICVISRHQFLMTFLQKFREIEETNRIMDFLTF